MIPGNSGLSFLKSIKLSSILEGTSKTLGVINQAIPIYNQAKPIISNMKTLFKITNSLKEEPEEKKNISKVFFV